MANNLASVKNLHGEDFALITVIATFICWVQCEDLHVYYPF